MNSKVQAQQEFIILYGQRTAYPTLVFAVVPKRIEAEGLLLNKPFHEDDTDAVAYTEFSTDATSEVPVGAFKFYSAHNVPFVGSGNSTIQAHFRLGLRSDTSGVSAWLTRAISTLNKFDGKRIEKIATFTSNLNKSNDTTSEDIYTHNAFAETIERETYDYRHRTMLEVTLYGYIEGTAKAYLRLYHRPGIGDLTLNMPVVW